jgi:hypothetical protein
VMNPVIYMFAMFQHRMFVTGRSTANAPA